VNLFNPGDDVSEQDGFAPGRALHRARRPHEALTVTTAQVFIIVTRLLIVSAASRTMTLPRRLAGHNCVTDLSAGGASGGHFL